MDNKDTTITDKLSIKLIIIDETKFSKLSIDEQIIFEILRDSMLEIMPLTNNSYDVECIRYAENYAFINLKVFTIGVEKIINSKIKELEDKLNNQIRTIQTTINSSVKIGL